MCRFVQALLGVGGMTASSIMSTHSWIKQLRFRLGRLCLRSKDIASDECGNTSSTSSRVMNNVALFMMANLTSGIQPKYAIAHYRKLKLFCRRYRTIFGYLDMFCNNVYAWADQCIDT